MDIQWSFKDSNFWADFHRQQDGTLQQAWDYGAALEQLGLRVERALVRDSDGAALVAAQFICRRMALYLNLASCARGPVWSPRADGALRAQVLRLLRKTLPLGALRVPLFSFESSAEALPAGQTRGLSRVMTGYSTVMLDITQEEPALRAQLEGKWRNRLVKALAQPKLQVHAAPSPSRLQWLLEREEQQRQERHFGGLPARFVEAYVAQGGKNRPNFVVGWAEHGRQTVAAMLFLLHGPRATYHIGWASDEGRELNAHNAVLWKSLPVLRSHAVRTLDLGGVNTRDLAGISRFKLGTGGTVLTLAGTYF